MAASESGFEVVLEEGDASGAAERAQAFTAGIRQALDAPADIAAAR